MDLAQIESMTKDVVVKYLHVAPEKIGGATTWADLNADSLARIEVTLALEDTFKVIIPDEESIKFKTFADVVGFLDRQLGNAQPPAPASPAP